MTLTQIIFSCIGVLVAIAGFWTGGWIKKMTASVDKLTETISALPMVYRTKADCDAIRSECREHLHDLGIGSKRKT